MASELAAGSAVRDVAGGGVGMDKTSLKTPPRSYTTAFVLSLSSRPGYCSAPERKQRRDVTLESPDRRPVLRVFAHPPDGLNKHAKSKQKILTFLTCVLVSRMVVAASFNGRPPVSLSTLGPSFPYASPRHEFVESLSRGPASNRCWAHAHNAHYVQHAHLPQRRPRTLCAMVADPPERIIILMRKNSSHGSKISLFVFFAASRVAAKPFAAFGIEGLKAMEAEPPAGNRPYVMTLACRVTALKMQWTVAQRPHQLDFLFRLAFLKLPVRDQIRIDPLPLQLALTAGEKIIQVDLMNASPGR